MAAPTHSPQFQRGLASIIRGDRLIAPVRSYLQDPDFHSFDVKVSGLEKRQPDGHFWPSTHPGWTDMALYLYLTEPHKLIPELQEPTAVLSMTAGSIWHSIMGHVVTELGLVHSLEQKVEDPLHFTRGKVDGIMDTGDEIWEFKTAKENLLRLIKSVEDYITRYPGYQRQANEYMRMSGIKRERVLMMSLTFPYEMREFVLEYDHRMGDQQVRKYERVLQAVADQRPPTCEGCYKSTDCPARGVCTVRLEEQKARGPLL